MPESLTKFQKTREIRTKFVSVWIEESDSAKTEMFYCPRCRTPVSQIEGNLVSVIPGRGPGKAPIIIQCKNKTCGRKYFFREIIKKESV